MPFITKLLSLASSNPTAPSSRTTGRHSISPKLRTFFGPPTPTDPKPPSPKATCPQQPPPALGVLESPQSAYSGVASLGSVEIVRRVSRGKVKRVEIAAQAKAKGYASVSVGTQTDDVIGEVGAGSVRDVLKRRSGLVWEMLHGGGAGLLFVASLGEMDGKGEGEEGLVNGSMPLTGALLRKLQRAIAVDAELQAVQKRGAREAAVLGALEERLRKRKEVLKGRLKELKGEPGAELDEEKLAVDKELVRVWEASIEAMDERLRGDERLERKRGEFESASRAALAVLALGLAERMLVDIEEVETAGSEVEFEQKYRLTDRLW